MKTMTIDQLVKLDRYRSWLYEPGFFALYVRVGPWPIMGKVHDKVIQLASFEVEDKGKGVFTRFAKKIESYGLPIFIENVLNERFAKYLPKIGFTKINFGDDRDIFPCFFMAVATGPSLESFV